MEYYFFYYHLSLLFSTDNNGGIGGFPPKYVLQYDLSSVYLRILTGYPLNFIEKKQMCSYQYNSGM